jgi:hypothetical protein
MPKYKNSKEITYKIVIEKTAFIVPVVSTKEFKKNDKSYLVTSRIADYIEMLETELQSRNIPLPKLPLKEDFKSEDTEEFE